MITIAVRSEVTTPIARVTPKPLTGPVAKTNSRPAASRVVTWESATALHTLPNAVVSGRRRSRPVAARPSAAYSSLARSKTRTFASTAMPMARTNPARPGSVSVAPRATTAAYEISP